MKALLISFVAISVLASCDNAQQPSSLDEGSDQTVINFNQLTLEPKHTTQRWYFAEQAERGAIIFASHCAVCHGRQAESTPHWKTPTDSGHYPPPPLNGSAHAWHHPLSILGRTIYNGGAPVGGLMPPFKDKLSESDIIDVIAHFQSYWDQSIYERWLEIEMTSRRYQQ